MKSSTRIRMILFGLAYGINLFSAFALWLCGQAGNILLGILLIAVYRLSLWFTPIVVTVICWLPWKPKVPVRKKLLQNFAHLLFCGILFATCFLLFGNWY